MAHNIRTEIARLAVDIDTLTTHPRNVRQGDVGAAGAQEEQAGPSWSYTRADDMCVYPQIMEICTQCLWCFAERCQSTC